MSMSYFLGIDVGTQGARVVLLTEKGEQLGSREEVFPLSSNSREEQSPLEWWDCCARLIPALLNDVSGRINREKIKSIAVTSTSGTIVAIDNDANPLVPAIMYSDPRSVKEGAECKRVAEENLSYGYTAFNASSGLPKMLWFVRNFPERLPQLSRFIHAADFITGRLCGEYGITDHTNAMKSGYDLHHDQWHDFIFSELGLQREWFQQVKASGSPIGKLKTTLCHSWGLSMDVQVTTGVTDGCASQIASGAVSPGQWNTTIGTTLVIKGVTKKELVDPSGALYNHRHPDGYWMPGGASNTGADWVSEFFPGKNLALLNESAAALVPTDILAWPLLRNGERFPIVAPTAKGFWPTDAGEAQLFASCMEGVAFIERYAFEQIEKLSGETVSAVYTAGGGSNSDLWLQIRSSVLNKPVHKMQLVSGAAGAAILAASLTHYSSLHEAAAAMVHANSIIQPDPVWQPEYETRYRTFIRELQQQNLPVEIC